MRDPREHTVPAAEIRRCGEADWGEVRRLHIKLALGFPLVVDVDLNEVFATPDGYWKDFVRKCARDADQALFLAQAPASCVGMGYVHRQGTAGRLEMLYVDGSRRRQGIGAALVGAQESWARAAGATELVAHIADSSAGVRLAEELGWQRSEEIFFTKNGLKEHKWSPASRSSAMSATTP
jgi:GNAT superfamily N-acetyltransferase